MYYCYDVIVVGVGGVGLMLVLYVVKGGVFVVCIFKFYFMCLYIGVVQGGIGVVFGNIQEDYWEWYMFDIIKGGDYLIDQDVVEVFSKDIIEVVYEFEYMGLFFLCMFEGKIVQCKFGGYICDFGKVVVECLCYVKDCIGYMIFQILY